MIDPARSGIRGQAMDGEDQRSLMSEKNSKTQEPHQSDLLTVNLSRQPGCNFEREGLNNSQQFQNDQDQRNHYKCMHPITGSWEAPVYSPTESSEQPKH
jgi:hypothetical protein